MFILIVFNWQVSQFSLKIVKIDGDIIYEYTKMSAKMRHCLACLSSKKITLSQPTTPETNKYDIRAKYLMHLFLWDKSQVILIPR